MIRGRFWEVFWNCFSLLARFCGVGWCGVVGCGVVCGLGWSWVGLGGAIWVGTVSRVAVPWQAEGGLEE